MNNTLETIKNRRSCKNFSNEMIDKELVKKVVEAGVCAPSGMNKQSPIILAVTNSEVRNKLSSLNASIMNRDIDPFYGAPVVLVVLADRSIPTYIYDGSVVMENMLLAAESLGLGACWIHRAKEVFETEEGKSILKSLGINGDYEGIGHCVLGKKIDEGKEHSIKDNYVFYID